MKKVKRIEYAIVTQWFKHGDHEKVTILDELFDPEEAADARKCCDERLLPKLTSHGWCWKANRVVCPSDFIIEYLHSCKHCGGGNLRKPYIKDGRMTQNRYLCKDCGSLSNHTDPKTGRIKVMSEQEYKDSGWSECDD